MTKKKSSNYGKVQKSVTRIIFYSNMTSAEATALVLFGLDVTPQIAFDTLAQLDFAHLTTVPKEEALELIMDTAEDLMLDAMGQKLDFLFNRAGLIIPEEIYTLDLIFNMAHDYEEIRACYHNLVAHGLMSSTFIDVVAQVQGLYI